MAIRREIAEALAKEGRVERIILSVTHSRAMNADLQDLAQIVYLAILEYDEDKIKDLWESNAMDFFIVRLVMNQYRSSHSPFRDAITRFRSITEDIREFQLQLQEGTR